MGVQLQTSQRHRKRARFLRAVLRGQRPQSRKMVVTLAERQAAQRAEALQGLAVGLLADLKVACGTAHELGRRQLTWGTVVPGVFAGSDEDMDDVLAMLATLMAEDRKSTNLGFQKIEWCKAQAPTQWVEQPSRFGSHMHIRVHWSDEDAAYFG
eukprot:s2009_g2.t1